MPDILLAGPDHFHRSIDMFADAHGALGHVRFEPPSKAAAEQVLMHRDLVGRQARSFGGILLDACDGLRADPDFT